MDATKYFNLKKEIKFELKKNQFLSGAAVTVLRDVVTVSRLACSRQCSLEPLCLGANFNKASGVCNLLEDLTDGTLIADTDFSYLRKDIPPRLTGMDFTCFL